jgi:GT2 family glycosyltransferase
LDATPLGGRLTAKLLSRRVEEALADDPRNDPDVSVVIRAYNEGPRLAKVLDDVQRQLFHADVEVIVIDHESTDRTAEIVDGFGAARVTLPQAEFTYPKSMNLAMESATHDIVFVTVAHASLSNVHTLHAGARHFAKNARVAGVFGKTLPNEGASFIERWGTSIHYHVGLARPAQQVRRAGMGTLAGTGAMVSKRAWRELGRFDLRYETGGEDTALANAMLNNGYEVVLDPALTVHHSHGLGLRDSVRQHVRQLAMSRAPREFDREELLRRRPDLRANEKREGRTS